MCPNRRGFILEIYIFHTFSFRCGRGFLGARWLPISVLRKLFYKAADTNSTSRRVFIRNTQILLVKLSSFFVSVYGLSDSIRPSFIFFFPPPPPSNMGEWRWKHFSVDIAFYRVCSICDISFHVILSYFRYFYWFSACAFLGIYFYSSSIRKSSVVFDANAFSIRVHFSVLQLGIIRTYFSMRNESHRFSGTRQFYVFISRLWEDFHLIVPQNLYWKLYVIRL